MDELSEARKGQRAELLRPLGVNPNVERLTDRDVHGTGLENEILALPDVSSRELSDLEGRRTFIVGLDSPYATDRYL
jgi:hypothetical protein